MFAVDENLGVGGLSIEFESVAKEDVKSCFYFLSSDSKSAIFQFDI
jgi:hypothetical protein